MEKFSKRFCLIVQIIHYVYDKRLQSIKEKGTIQYEENVFTIKYDCYAMFMSVSLDI